MMVLLYKIAFKHSKIAINCGTVGKCPKKYNKINILKIKRKYVSF